jgi:hypothetical protein
MSEPELNKESPKYEVGTKFSMDGIDYTIYEIDHEDINCSWLDENNEQKTGTFYEEELPQELQGLGGND